MAIVLFAGLAGSGFGQSGFHIGEGNGNQDQSPGQTDGPSADPASPPTAPESSGPVRMARFSYLSGSVTWRPDHGTEWANATLNMPLREGAEVWVGDGGRAELQFDDGSVVRFGSGAVATLQTLFSDSQGEFTEIKLTDGLASMDLRTDHSIFQLDTPKGAIKSTGPSRVRVGVDDDVEIGIREGSAALDGVGGKVTLHAGDYVDITPNATNFEIEPLPGEDTWDKFTDERHALLSHQDPNLPENLRFMGGDLDQYGSWKQDSDYGQVWAPQEPEGWSPYTAGRWVWCDPFGWTWVGAEPWGWAPYHYGSWVHRHWGWAWVPGPVHQYWSPGVVNFCETDGVVCWTPLAPFECRYPAAFGLGVWGGGWSAWFSIGFCGAWFPFGADFCGERPWNNRWVNRWHGGPGRFGDTFGHHDGGFVAGAGVHFHPANAAFGTVSVSEHNFGSGGAYSRVSGRSGQDLFERGQSFGAPQRGSGFVAGPTNVRPNATSWSSSRSFTNRPESTGIMQRPVYGGNSFGSRGPSSGSSAAQAARESLGWSRGSSGGYTPRGGGSQGGSSSGSFTPRSSSGSGTGSRTQRGGWSVPDHSGWSHVHSDTHSSSSSKSGSGSSGGSRGH